MAFSPASVALGEVLELEPDTDPVGPSQLLGVEHEFECYEGGRQQDFRNYVHPLVRTLAPESVAAGPYAYHLESGCLLVCDGWEAELAVPPEPLAPGSLSRLSAGVQAQHEKLLELIQRANRIYRRGISLTGFSTHLSVYCSMVDVDSVARVYARTMAPAMALLMDLPTSPGLLVRPRPRRLEVGGEYVPPGPYLETAMTFLAGSFLAVWEAVLHGDIERLPFRFRGRVERSVQRYGYYVDRAAFGEDVYDRGRDARLRLHSGETVRAQTVLEVCWDYITPYLLPLTERHEREQVARVIEGREPLPLELAPAPDYLIPVGASGRDLGRTDFAAAFRECLHPPPGPNGTIKPHLITWDFVVFEYRSRSGGTCFINVPRRFLRAFIRILGRLFALFDRFLAGGLADGAYLDDPALTEAPGIYLSVEPDKLELPNQSGKKKSKPPPGRKKEGCSVAVLRKEDAGQGADPVIEICIPVTKDSLTPLTPQEPPLNAAKKALGIYLHNGGFVHEVEDHTVLAIGMDYRFTRHYRSFIEHNGVMGQRWDHTYNQRVVPTRPELARSTDFGWCERYEGPDLSKSGNLWFYDGTGRRTFHSFSRWDNRTVRKHDGSSLIDFKAVVTHYTMNPGERFELQRFAVYEGRSPWGTPVYYVWRNHHGEERIFNCHGYIIAWRDHNRNTMRFEYGLPYNPGTNYLVLRGIEDTTGRQYSLDYAFVGFGLRLISVTDPWNRVVRFEYNADAELTGVTGTPGQQGPHRRIYRYQPGRRGLLTELIDPREAASPSPRSSVQVQYDGAGRVLEQRVGAPDGVTPKVGGTYGFAYQDEWVREMTDRNGNVTRFEMTALNGTRVLTRMTELNVPYTIPNVQYQEPDRYETTLEHDAHFQLTRLVHATGSTSHYTYEQANAPVTQGDERDWVERNLTFVHNLSRGNVLEIREQSFRVQDGSRLYTWRYEPLYNAPFEIVTPAKTTVHRYNHGWSASPENNANALETTESPQLRPDGSSVPVRATFEYQKGGLLARAVDPDSIATTFAYDPAGTQTSKTRDPGGQAIGSSATTNERGLVTAGTDEMGIVSTYAYDDRDNVVEIRNAHGHKTTLTYDLHHNLVQSEREIADVPAQFTYTMAPQRTLTITYEHDFLDLPVKEAVDPGGLNISSEKSYWPEGQLREERSPRAVAGEEPAAIKQYFYNSRGLLAEVKEAPAHANERSRYRLYHPDESVRAEVAANGGLTSFVVNGFGEIVQVRDAVGGVTRYEHDGAGRPVRQFQFGTIGGATPTDRSGGANTLLRQEQYVHDADGNMIKRTALAFDPADRAAGSTPLVYWKVLSAGGATLEERESEGRTERYEYDSAGRHTRTIEPNGNTVDYEYGRSLQVLKETRTERIEGSPILGGNPIVVTEITRTYDALGKLSSESSPAGGTTLFAYDNRGLFRAASQSSGLIREYRYDLAGRQTDEIRTIDPTSYVSTGTIATATEYNANNSPKKKTDARGNATEYEYDALDRLSRITLPNGGGTGVTFNALDQPEQIVYPRRDAVVNEHDLLGRLIARRQSGALGPFRVEQRFEYDGLGRNTRMVDATEVTARYNSVGWVLREEQDGEEIVYTHDLSGLVRTLRYPSGVTYEIQRHASGQPSMLAKTGHALCDYTFIGQRLEERSVPAFLEHAAGGSSNRYYFPLITKKYYDPRGRLSGFAHFLHDEVTDPAHPSSIYLYRYGPLTYDGAGRLTGKRHTLSGFEHHETYEYDKLDRLIGVEANPCNVPGVLRETTEILHDAGNNQREVVKTIRTAQLETIVMKSTTTPTALNAPEQIVTEITGEPPRTRTVGYDAGGSLLTLDVEIPATPPLQPTPARRRTFYDALGRLAMTFLETPGTEPNIRIYYRHDALGRCVERHEQRVRGPANTVLSERFTRYIYWRDRCIEELERDNSQDPWQRVRRYYHGVEPGELVAMDVAEDYVSEDVNNDGQVAGAATLIFMQDVDKSPLGLARAEFHGSRFVPFFERYYTDAAGNVERYHIPVQGAARLLRESLTGHPIGHHGRIFHPPEGLYYNGARFYDPALGQFISVDAAGAWYDAAGMGNGYVFAGNNPVMYTDDGNVIVPVLVVAGFAIATYLLAEATESDIAAAFSPLHQIAAGVAGVPVFGGRELTGFERGLSIVDGLISLIPGAGFFTKVATGGKLLKAAVVADKAVKIARIGTGLVGAGYGFHVGWQHGSYAAMALSVMGPAAGALGRAVGPIVWPRVFSRLYERGKRRATMPDGSWRTCDDGPYGVTYPDGTIGVSRHITSGFDQDLKATLIHEAVHTLTQRSTWAYNRYKRPSLTWRLMHELPAHFVESRYWTHLGKSASRLKEMQRFSPGVENWQQFFYRTERAKFGTSYSVWRDDLFVRDVIKVTAAVGMIGGGGVYYASR